MRRLLRLPRPRPRPRPRRALAERGNKGPPRPYDESYRGNAVRWTERQQGFRWSRLNAGQGVHVAAAWVYFGAFCAVGSVLVVYNFVTGVPRRIYEIYDHTVNPRAPDATEEVRNPLYRDVGFGDDQLHRRRRLHGPEQTLSPGIPRSLRHLFEHGAANALKWRRVVERQVPPHEDDARRQYTGVYWDAGRKKWKAQIAIETKREALGRFDKKSDAARAYDDRARMLGRGHSRDCRPRGCTADRHVGRAYHGCAGTSAAAAVAGTAGDI